MAQILKKNGRIAAYCCGSHEVDLRLIFTYISHQKVTHTTQLERKCHTFKFLKKALSKQVALFLCLLTTDSPISNSYLLFSGEMYSLPLPPFSPEVMLFESLELEVIDIRSAFMLPATRAPITPCWFCRLPDSFPAMSEPV